MAEELGLKELAAGATLYLGEIASARGDHAEGLALCAKALVMSRELGDKNSLALALEGFAGVLAAAGEERRAVRLAGAAAELRRTINATLSPDLRRILDSWLEGTRRALGADAYERALAEGRAMTLEQAIQHALEPARPPGGG